MKRVGAFLTVGILAGTVLFAAGGVSAQSADLPEGPGKAFATENCSGCHGLELVTAQRRSSEEWEQVVNRMIANGDTLTEEQYKELVDYLGTHLGT